jgi:hypothetical protein
MRLVVGSLCSLCSETNAAGEHEANSVDDGEGEVGNKGGTARLIWKSRDL